MARSSPFLIRETGLDVTINHFAKKKGMENMFENFGKQEKYFLQSANKTINALYKFHNEGFKWNFSPETLGEIDTGRDILEAKRDELEDCYLEWLTSDLSEEIDSAVEKIESTYLEVLEGTKKPEGSGNRAGFDNAKRQLAEKMAKLLLDEIICG